MEVETMALNQWSKRSLVQVIAACAIGGFLIGSSSSQEANPSRDRGEIGPGRYQMVVSPGAKMIFDTKTGRFWQETNYSDNAAEPRWSEHLAPWEKRKQ
jgi:hypothetical protein